MIEHVHIQIIPLHHAMKQKIQEQQKYYTRVDVPVGTIKKVRGVWQFNSLIAGFSDMTENKRITIVKALYEAFPGGYFTGV